jgi:hypothetical protein
MDCPILAKWRNSPVGFHSFQYLKLVKITPELQTSFSRALQGEKPEDFQSLIGERVYFLVGSALAAMRDWNRMTFLQLEHEARVQGFLGPNEKHNHSEWRLRVMLEMEARQVEEEEKKKRKVA